MNESIPAEEQDQPSPQQFVGGDVHVLEWDPESGLPPPLPQEETSILLTSTKEQPPVFDDSMENTGSPEGVPVLNSELMSLGLGDGGVYSEKWNERLAEFIGEKRNLPPGAEVELYHGFGGAGLEKALEMLESSDQGVRQISGPTLCVYPVGQFWKSGAAGLKYLIPREQLEFSGESNPKAKFHVHENGNVEMINGLEALPLSDFKGAVLRSEKTEYIYAEGEDPRFDSRIEPIGKRVIPLSMEEREIEAKIKEKLNKFSQDREERQIYQHEKSIREMLSGKE
jgi:hypothetical protein